MQERRAHSLHPSVAVVNPFRWMMEKSAARRACMPGRPSINPSSQLGMGADFQFRAATPAMMIGAPTVAHT